MTIPERRHRWLRNFPWNNLSNVTPFDTTCLTRIYLRSSVASGDLFAPEIAWAPGPPQVQNAGPGTVKHLFGSNGWFLQQCSTDYSLNLYRVEDDGTTVTLIQEGAGPDEWVAPVAGTDYDGAASKHWSLAFEVTADPAVAWQEGTNLYVTQIDAQTQTRVVRGPFTGTDPVLFNDSRTLGTTEDADVILFYLSTDRQTLNYRLERDQYDTEYAMTAGNLGTFTQGTTTMYLDGVQYTALRTQLLVANSSGVPFTSGGQIELLTDYAPVKPLPARVEVTGHVAGDDLEHEVFIGRSTHGSAWVEVLAASTDLEHELFILRQEAGSAWVEVLAASTDLEHELFRYIQASGSAWVEVLAASTDLEHELFVVREESGPSPVEVLAASTDLEHQTV